MPFRHRVLAGVIEHQGTFEGGHYVAFVSNGGRWYRMNDSVVQQVEPAVVFQTQAFMLFYRALHGGETAGGGGRSTVTRLP